MGCEQIVESAVSGLPGIIEAKASYPKGSVVVRYDPAVVSPDQIAQAIVAETYFTVGEAVAGGELTGDRQAVQGASAVIRVEGMSDERTASLVTRAMGAVGPAILDVSLDPAQSALTVTYDSERVSAETLIDAITRGSGLQASLVFTSSAGGDSADSVDYTPYVVIGVAALFALSLAWPAISWARRQMPRPSASPHAHRKRQR